MEKGRHYTQYRPVNQRVCTACTGGHVESEVHFLLYCEHYTAERRLVFEKICEMYPVFSTLSDVDKYNYLMSVDEADTCGIVVRFVRDCFVRTAQSWLWLDHPHGAAPGCDSTHNPTRHPVLSPRAPSSASDVSTIMCRYNFPFNSQCFNYYVYIVSCACTSFGLLN